MWKERVDDFLAQSQHPPQSLIGIEDPNDIFSVLKVEILKDEHWELISSIFSPIVLHIVSELVLDVLSDENNDGLQLIILFSRLIRTFPSIRPLILFYNEKRPISEFTNLDNADYLKAVFRLKTVIGDQFEIQLSPFLRLLNCDLSPEAAFYLIHIVSNLNQTTETETKQFLDERCPLNIQTALLIEESKEEEKKIIPSNHGPIRFTKGLATTVDDVPFLKTIGSPELEISSTTSPHSRNVALSLLTGKPVMLIGEAGSGKSSTILHLASLAGANVVSLHLGSAVDAKSLLGGYVCSDIPGEFKWLDGPLTRAVKSGSWIVFEQLEAASPDVISVIAPLLGRGRLFVPGHGDVRIGPNTKIFATCLKRIDSPLWAKVSIGLIDKSKLASVIAKTHPNISSISQLIADSFNSCNDLTYHELFRLCRRLEALFNDFGVVGDKVSENQYDELFRCVVDTFTAHLPDFEQRFKAAEDIAKIWQFSPSRAEALLCSEKPKLITEPFQIGCVSIPQMGLPTPPLDFAPTFTSLRTMECVCRAISLSEPVLLVGETGTGKTTLVQFVASCIGANLTVVNMHHQSDSLDIVGGFKPVDFSQKLAPIRDEIIRLLRETGKKTSDGVLDEKNQEAIKALCNLFDKRKWKKFLNTARIKFCDPCIAKLESENNALLNDWINVRDQCKAFRRREEFLERGFAFDFVEGPLAKAFQSGGWILLDEVNLAPTETLLSLAPILDGTLPLPNGKIIKAHPDFRLICCMNPATDVGKTNLPATLIRRFTTVYSVETSSESDIRLILSTRGVNERLHKTIFDFYTKARELSRKVLTDGSGRRVMYTLRALTRAIDYVVKAEKVFGPLTACYDALKLSFVAPLCPESADTLLAELKKYIKEPVQTSDKSYTDNSDNISIEGYPISKGPLPVIKRPDFILTPTARTHLKALSQAVFLGTAPVLLQGPTSSGKTTLVKYMADITGHKFVRINNHEHTDISEYIGQYTTTEQGGFSFTEGALVKAVREGSWVVLDELNLAPSDVLEALNRLLDQNNELYVAETQQTIKPGPGFMLFATQNPPGVYGGRKQLSRAFRGRFVELHIDEIDPKELNQIIIDRCGIAPPFAKAMVDVFCDLRSHRQFSDVFAGKQSFLTVRDLLRWANRSPSTWEEVADEGFALLGERLRTNDERNLMKNVLMKYCKLKTMPLITKTEINSEMNIVWTTAMKRTVDLVKRCIENGEPVLLVGETGTGKTTSCQVVAKMLERNLKILNCHQHTESADFLGAMRPSRNNENNALFEWFDGALVSAMRNGDIFLLDEISLAQDSALERLNPVLEPERKLPLAEKPIYEEVTAHQNFALVATMNPGGDHGKRELSPSLRSRFTEIWVPSIENDDDLREILCSNCTKSEIHNNVDVFIEFVRFAQSVSLQTISLRDILQWIRFVESTDHVFGDSFVQGAFMVFIDSSHDKYERTQLTNFLSDLISRHNISIFEPIGNFDCSVSVTDNGISVGYFNISTENTVGEPNFVFSAPTTSSNLLRVARSLQLRYPVLIEGPPGVGKTSLIASLGQFLGEKVVRINLSEHTEMIDLVGSELPVEGAKSGSFEWRDGAFLTALRNGWWVILDELNLASQSVLEGLNSCLDHRAALFVPELGVEFKCHPNFRIFGCQNPAGGGGGRKQLPRSFLNRFSRVYVDELGPSDFDCIISGTYKTIPNAIRSSIVDFLDQINSLHLDFEFNLRDVFRLCDLLNNNVPIGVAVRILFIDRLRNSSDIDLVLDKASTLFGALPKQGQILISPNLVRVGSIEIQRCGGSKHTKNIIHPALIRPLEAVLTCALMNWPCLLVGSTATGKSSVLRAASHLVGRHLVEFSMNSSVDTAELLGGFEQVDPHRRFEQILSQLKIITGSNADALSDLELVNNINELVSYCNQYHELVGDEFVEESQLLMERENDPGRFEWVDGLLLQSMRNGWWIVIDNANLCPPAVLDRLNPLCEPGGYLSLNERGLVNGEIEDVHPHEDFRLFMTVDPSGGEISRAMRNRAIEVFMPSFAERMKNDDITLKHECLALGGEYGSEFLNSVGCEETGLNTWNMLAYINFRQQVSIAQLDPKSVKFDIAQCQISDENDDNKSDDDKNDDDKEKSDENSFDPVISCFKFSSITDTIFAQIFYDAAYLIQKNVCEAAIRVFIGNSRQFELDQRIIFSEQVLPNVVDILHGIRNYYISAYDNEMPLDRCLWPEPLRSLSLPAIYLLVSADLMPNDVNDVEDIGLQMRISNLIPSLYSEITDTIQNAIDTDNVQPCHLIVLRIIDYLNKKRENSLSLLRFIRSILRHSSIDLPNLEKLKGILCPGLSQDARKLRNKLGEPFTFKDENTFNLWQSVNEYWINLINKSDAAFQEQSADIISILSFIIMDPSKYEKLQKIFSQIQKKSLPKEISITFVDEIEEYEKIYSQPTTVCLSTPFPSELLMNLSHHSISLHVLDCIVSKDPIKLPQTFAVMLDLIAFIESYKKTGSYTDLVFALFEIIHEMPNSLLSGPALPSIKRIIDNRPNLLQTQHMKKLHKSLYDLLIKIPSAKENDIINMLCATVNIEAQKLGLPFVESDSFIDSFNVFAAEKWRLISSIGEVDDSFYHLVVSKLSNELITELENQKQIMSEIITSRVGHSESILVETFQAEIDPLRTQNEKSQQKARFRGDGSDFSHIKSIISRISFLVQPNISTESISSLNESASELLNRFPLYRDLIIPSVTALRQLSFGASLTKIETNINLPFPFTSHDMLISLFESDQYMPQFSFSLIGHSIEVIHPALKMDFPRLGPDYSTLTEEEKQEKQIAELFSRRRKEKLNIYASCFVESMLRPNSLIPEKALDLLYKQLIEHNYKDNPSIEEDLYYLPLFLHQLKKEDHFTTNRNNHKKINVYQNSSPSELTDLYEVVKLVIESASNTWQRYPGHEQLRRIVKSANSLLKLPSDLPLIEFLNGLESLMDEIRDWQFKARDFEKAIRPLVKLANKWLKMRLESWRQLFTNRRKILSESTGREFYTLLIQLESTDDTNISDFLALCADIIDKSPIGILSANLDLLEAFAIYSLRFSIGTSIFPLINNLITKFRAFNKTIEEHISTGLSPIERDVHGFITTLNWDTDSDKKHMIRIESIKRQLNKYCQQHVAVLQPIFNQMVDQFTSNIFRETETPYDLNSSIDEETNKLMNDSQPLRTRIYEARIYASEQLDIHGGKNQERLDIGTPLGLLLRPTLYGSVFNDANNLYGTALLLLTAIRKKATDHNSDIQNEEALNFLGIAENMIIRINEHRENLSVEPSPFKESPIFVVGQIVSVLKSFAEIDNNKEVEKIAQDVEGYSKLSNVPIKDIVKSLRTVNDKLKSNYIHLSISLFIERSIETLEKYDDTTNTNNIPQINESILTDHISFARFAVSFMKKILIALVDGYGENKDQNEEQNEDDNDDGEMKDGTGLGEGLGNEDITNEIESDAQLEGDNINTNEDKQDEDDVEKEGGFEMDQDLPEDAPDLEAGEEDQNDDDVDDKMGSANDEDQINEREAEDDSKAADKEADIEREKTEERQMQKEDDEENEGEQENENEDENEQQNNQNEQIEMEEEEDLFESDAAQWNENPEEVPMPEEQDHLLDNIDEAIEANEGEEEEDEELVCEKPPDIEEIPDEYENMVAQDKKNKEEEDNNEVTQIEGEGEQNDEGVGQSGVGKEDKEPEMDQEDDEKDDNDEKGTSNERNENDEIQKQLEIVEKEILEGNTRDGEDGGEIDDQGTEGVILPANDDNEKPKELPEQEDIEINDDNNDNNANPANQDDEIEINEVEHKEHDEGEMVHMNFDKKEENVVEIEDSNITFYKANITMEDKQKWREITNETHNDAAQLCEKLRLVLEANVTAKMRGDYRTGKRLNMRKIIPFIASGFRKDKIWMRRVQPDKRNYQVMLCIDNSKSMSGKAGELAIQSVSLITQALSLLGIGDLCVTKFGSTTEIVHKIDQKWNDESGPSIINAFTFDEKETNAVILLENVINYLEKSKTSDSLQLCFIISDGFIQNRAKVREFVIQAALKNIVLVFLIVDLPDNGITSILDLKVFTTLPDGKSVYKKTIDLFPFDYYIVIQKPELLPERLSDALKQWFDLANSQ